jgi:acyl-coenzyme A thioesterase PaaI-like protein
VGVTAATVFDEATAATPAGEGRYDVLPDARFTPPPAGAKAEPAVNGGVLLASMLRGVLAESVHPHPVATSANFLRVPRIAPAQVRVTWLKQGRTVSVARAVLVQDDVPLVDATVTTGSAAAAPSPPDQESSDSPERTGAGHPVTPSEHGVSWSVQPPALPPVGDCVELRPNGGISDQVDLRLDPATAGWLNREPAGIPEMRGYFRLRDGREPDAYLLAFAVDAMPPVVFGLGAISWAPTVELTWYMRAVPAPGLLRVAARCRNVSAGWFDEEAEVWDSAGRLVAQSRQLARVGRPPAAR